MKTMFTTRYCSLCLLALFILPQKNLLAAEFFTDFESANVTTVRDFSVSDNGITATLSGGTAFRIGNGALYHSGDQSWMVEPAGSNERGTHTGSGTITFNTPMKQISLWVRSESSGVFATVSLLDVDGNFAENSPVIESSSSSWTQLDFTVTEGAPLLKSVLFEVSGSGMAAIDDLGGNSESASSPPVSNPPPESASGGGGGGSLFYGLVILALVVLRLVGLTRQK